MLKKIILSFSFMGFLTLMAFGQVVTPPLDQTVRVKAGTATPWRYFDSVGAYYNSTSGEEKSSDVKSSDFEGTVTGGNAVLFFDMFGLEVDLLSKLVFKYTGIDSAIGERNIEISKQNIYLTYRFGEYLVIAAESMKGSKKKDIINSTSTISQENDVTKTGFGLSLRLAGPFFIAYGVREVENTGSGKISPVSYTLKTNSWKETYYGVAMLTGAPGENQLRLEYSSVSSPETRKEGTCSTCDNHHQKTENTVATAEAKLGNWLFHYSTEKTTASDLSFKSETNEASTVSIVKGVAFIQESGLTVGFYQTTDEKTGKRNSSDITQNNRGTRLTLGMVF